MDDYALLFTNHPCKIVILALSISLTTIITPLMYTIISFERDNHHRTLINQLMASTVWTGIIWNLTVQQFDFYRSLFGSLPVLLCRINSILRNALPMHGLLLMDAIMIVKYFFLFQMKNPTAVQDDFWKLFLNISIAMFTFISQVIHLMSPGPSAPNFFVCIGSFPGDCLNQPAKKNYPLTLILVFSLLVYSVVGSRYFYYKYWTSKQGFVKSSTTSFSLSFNKNTLVSFTTSGIILFNLSLCILVLKKINNVELKALNEYPNDIWFYALHLTLPSSSQAVTVLVYFVKTKDLRRHVWVALCEMANMFYPQRRTRGDSILLC